jgi:hypothetical protein
MGLRARRMAIAMPRRMHQRSLRDELRSEAASLLAQYVEKNNREAALVVADNLRELGYIEAANDLDHAITNFPRLNKDSRRHLGRRIVAEVRGKLVEVGTWQPRRSQRGEKTRYVAVFDPNLPGKTKRSALGPGYALYSRTIYHARRAPLYVRPIKPGRMTWNLWGTYPFKEFAQEFIRGSVNDLATEALSTMNEDISYMKRRSKRKRA